jgi:hypothetical protein
MTGQDFLDAGLPIPGMHPTLPICPPSITDVPDQSAPRTRAEAAAIIPARPTCQADMRRAVFTPSLPRRVVSKRTVRTIAGTARPLHTGRHFAGPNHPQDDLHGVKASITVTNPDVDHGIGINAEVVAARTYAGSGIDWTEAGWVERSHFADAQYVYAGGREGAANYTDQFPLSVGQLVTLAVDHCGVPGELRVCGQIYWNSTWVDIWRLSRSS